MNLNTENGNVIFTTVTVEEIREEDDSLTEDLKNLLDEAQGKVFAGDEEKVYIVIEVTNG